MLAHGSRVGRHRLKACTAGKLGRGALRRIVDFQPPADRIGVSTPLGRRMYPIDGMHINLAQIVAIKLIDEFVKAPESRRGVHPNTDFSAFVIHLSNGTSHPVLCETPAMRDAAHAELLEAMRMAGH